MSTLRNRKQQDKWRRIRRAASSLFAERGFEGTTTRSIAQRADVGVGTVYLYAKTKHELLLSIFVESIEQAIERGFATVPNAPVVDRLVHLFDHFYEFYSRDVALARVLVQQMTFGDVDPQTNLRLVQEFNVRVAAMLTEAAACGELRADLPAATAANNAFAAYFAVLVGWLRGFFDAAARDARLREALELQIEGLRPAKDVR